MAEVDGCLEPQSFFGQYLLSHQPVLMKRCATSDVLPAVERWTEDYLEATAPRSTRTACPLREKLAKLGMDCELLPSELLSDVSSPNHARSCGRLLR